MKKIILSIAAVLMMSTGAFAQSWLGNKSDIWGAGPKFGLSFGGVGNLPDARHRIGITAGAFAIRDINCWFSLQGEVMFSQQGFTRFSGTPVNLNMSYINMALVPKFYLIDGFNFHTGLQFGYVISSKDKSDANWKYGPEALSMINKYSADALLGLGYDFDFGLVVEGRYMKGLSKFNVGQDAGLNNETFQILFGWRF